MLRSIIFMLAFSSFSLFAAEQDKTASPEAPSKGMCDPNKEHKPCKSKEECLNDPNCLCWCSQICGWRKKEKDDHPYYVENDPHGKHCYCKKWDFEHYVDNCIEKKGIKEPKGAE